MRTSLRFASVLAVVGLCSSAPLGDGVLLRLNYKTGEVLRYRLVQEQSLESELFGSIDTETAMVWKNVVREVDEQGVATVLVSYEGLRQETGGPLPTSFDSTRTGEDAKLNDPMLARMFEPMLDAELTMEIEPNGHIRRIGGIERMVEEVTEALGDSAPTVKPMFESIFGEESLRRMWEFAVFPEAPVEPGESWKRSFDMAIPMFGVMKMEFEQTFRGVETVKEKRCAQISLAGALSFEVDENLPISVTLDSPEVEGLISFSLDDGCFLELQTTIETDMQFAPRDGASGMPAMELSMSIAQKMVRLAADAPVFED